MAVWVFPIPFVFELTGGVFGAVFMGCVVMILGRQTIAKTPQARVLYNVSAVEAAMCFVYLVFSAVYHVLNGFQQLALILVLYVLKVFTRLSMANACCSSTDEEARIQSLARLPERVVFTANLFHLVNLITCLQGSRMSIWTIGTLVAIDTFSSAFSVKRLLHRPKMVLICTLPRDSKVIWRSQASVVPLNGPPVTAIPTKQPIDTITHGQFSHLLARESFRQSLPREEDKKPPANHVTTTSCGSRHSRLPNAVFYPALANTTPKELKASQFDVAVYAMLQIVSLIVFEQILCRRLQYSVLHQLGFVLETAAADIQAKLGMFIPYCFFFFLEHNGVDFSFQFAWMNNK
ncbi:hypothetical protein PC118_g4471 [Phytophthora cactorum]|uniref:Uncharacterized protein n=1 Tax=Phytophthora cactorum TaxID=29920 RepID=A0A8T1GNR4_9STRA|nr:hypothetical protein PC113_g5049 [Phytophthora cactorum]KAG2992589.1 hypothetical protein PC118_g4471 [Phytophthora cactorum]KAG3035126.1 hypothetical protein PC119_g4675 [Phytophthora cactorum]